VFVFAALSIAHPSAEAVNKSFAWNPPTQNVDGTPLTDLAGYEVAWGTSSRSYPNIRNVGSSTSTIVDFNAGTYFASVRAYDTSGNRGAYSNEVSFTIVSRCDINGSGGADASDVQQCVNQFTGAVSCSSADIDLDGQCTVVDIQRVVNNALGFTCVSP
jgi:hypothetical protein